MKKYSIILMAAIAVAMAGFYACDKKTDDPDNPDIPGDGSPNNPFKVVTVIDLKRVGTGEEGPGGFKWNRDKFYKQIRDIDLKGEANWTPIGSSASFFTGTYDGGGYTISNLTITGNEDERGLFGSLKGKASNIRLNHVNISGKSDVGCVAGKLRESAIIEHCSVSNIDISASGYAGGIAGGASVNSIVNACIVDNGTIAIGLTSVMDDCAGGIVGNSSATIKNCYASVNVDGRTRIGGIAGYSNSSIQYCYVTGNVNSVGGSIGGILGESGSNCKIQNCVALVRNIAKQNTGYLFLTFPTIGRITSYSDKITLNSNYASVDIAMTAGGDPVPLETYATTSGCHGESISPTEYNSAGWWKNTAGFPDSEWTFEDNKLPRLKGFDGLTQNPTIN